ncbi:MFS transporter [Sanguibacter antarcticus]|uniref:Putative MFS family arabinose efflux permease n=1 Tax=Sanguibacter antarcticus TaxID=372484 RepID=A0A2A9E6F1_9MICO|nr:MFS transporter [Sanguibacter antarcticus]PFG34236.1 putative MFS family arabinose efflux permease [Sanguibacter antarcticus]
MPAERRRAYRAVLSRPRVLTTFALSMIGRSAYALVFLPLFYAAQDAASSIAFAGIAVAAYGAGATFLAPLRAWLIDRAGAQTMLSILVLSFSASLTALAVASLVASPAWVVLALAGLAGSVAPPLGPTMRVAWRELLPGRDDRTVGLSLDSVVEELLYLAGPAVAGLLLAGLAPGYVMLVPAVLVAIGGLLFVRTSSVAQMRGGLVRPGAQGAGRALVLDPRFVALLLPALVAGGISGLVSVAVPAAGANLGSTATVGIALGVFAGGSAVGGLLYGAVRVPGSPVQQLTALSVLLVVGASGLALSPGTTALVALLGSAGLFFSPVMIVAYLAAPAAAGEHQQNAATTWVNTSHNLGSTLVSAVAGIAIQHAGIPFAVVVVCGAALGLVLLSALVLRRDPVGPPAAKEPSAGR